MRSAAAMACAALAGAFLVARPSPWRGPLPADARALAARVEAHPADWLAASALAEKALDAPVRDPLALWHASGALAVSLAPAFPTPRGSFARAAFFHWNELSAADRGAALNAYAPVMRDRTFLEMAGPLFALTGNFDYLRRVHPREAVAVGELATLAGTNGRFDDYRTFRDELEALHGDDRSMGRVDAFTMQAAREIAITIQTIESDDVPPYVEIYVDGARRAEGAVAAEQTFTVPADGAGAHHVEVRLANPRTRNSAQRKVRVIAKRAL